MNWSIFKDSKFFLWFSLALFLHAVGVTLIALSYSTWVIFVIAASMVTFFMVQRADYLYKSCME
ncbi:damage-inducible protein DinB [Bacillus cytotoxicus]|uniref:damage-inducible protein DinB n=1 Tax=Bacillus cereus group sp. BfR-BA-01492 TaxID=2920361 RepID=UPI001F5AD3A5|nr:damage-inducible protein DinB [Bacillus cereus group sp. BfR-BA-01492]EMA6341779.1 damage-inducible protein DinB [Bacillus cytotoxicus]